MKRVVVGLLLALIQVLGHADMLSVYTLGGETLTLSYRDNQHIRLDRNNGTYSVINGPRAVGVIQQGNNRVVLDAEQMAAMLGGVNAGQAVTVPDSRDVKLTDTGMHREIAGFTGKVFQVSDGRSVYRVVLTDHPGVIAASDALRHFIRRFAAAMGNEQGARILALDAAFLHHPYRGLLQIEGGLTLTSLADATRPDTFYRIPETTLNLPFPGMIQ